MVAVVRLARMPRRARLAGFTLIEILVVLLIIGIMSTALLTNLSITPQQPLQREAEKLAWLLQENALEARASGTPVVWRALPAGYEFSANGNPSTNVNSSVNSNVNPTTNPNLRQRTMTPEDDNKPRRYQLPSDIQVLNLLANHQRATRLTLSGRQLSGPSTITLGNQAFEIDVSSSGLDRFTTSPARPRSTHATY